MKAFFLREGDGGRGERCGQGALSTGFALCHQEPVSFTDVGFEGT